MKYYYKYLIISNLNLFIVIFSFLTTLSFAQPGKNGAVTIVANTVVNSYQRLNGNLAVGATAITLNAAMPTGLAIGDLIMIYQAQGATINTIDNVNYGDVTAYNNAGLYEFAYIQAVAGVNLTVSCGIKNAYIGTGITRAQVIKVPQYTTLTINAGFSILPTAWNGQTGGIVAISAQSIINNGSINASNSGFRGGALSNNNAGAGTDIITYRTIAVNDAGEKGEGIAGTQADYDLLNGRYGRGAAANGGGGANNHNAGGGGGSNGNNGNVWSGQGVMPLNVPAWSAGWLLDPGAIANGNAITNSSGGGRGGYSLSDANLNALLVGPGVATWLGDTRKERGGLGGRPLTAASENRIFFGGGGGAGHQNGGEDPLNN